MKKTVAYLFSTLIVAASLSSTSAQAAQEGQAVKTEAVLEVAVAADKVDFSDYAINGGPILALRSHEGGSALKIKCNTGIRDVSMIVFIQGSALRTQLTSKTSSMHVCKEKLKSLVKEIEGGADKLRLEIMKDHTINLVTTN